MAAQCGTGGDHDLRQCGADGDHRGANQKLRQVEALGNTDRAVDEPVATLDQTYEADNEQ